MRTSYHKPVNLLRLTMYAHHLNMEELQIFGRLSVESHEDSLPTTPFSAGPQDCRELYRKLTATQRQLMRAREAVQRKEGALLSMKVSKQ